MTQQIENNTHGYQPDINAKAGIQNLNTLDAGHWYLVYCKPNMETIARENLQNQTYQNYLPMIECQRRKNRRYRTTIEPMFPRYLFVHMCNGIDDWRPVRSTLGVQHVVRFGQHAAKVPDELIEYLHGRETQKGLQQLDTNELKIGDRVKIRQGIGQDIEGIITAETGKDRVQLLINLVNTAATMTVSKQNIVASK